MDWAKGVQDESVILLYSLIMCLVSKVLWKLTFINLLIIYLFIHSLVLFIKSNLIVSNYSDKDMEAQRAAQTVKTLKTLKTLKTAAEVELKQDKYKKDDPEKKIRQK